VSEGGESKEDAAFRLTIHARGEGFGRGQRGAEVFCGKKMAKFETDYRGKRG